jgi:protein-tyrosine phosphatase
MIDLHCHVLPGIDDGPATIDESVALVRAAAASGVREIVATPHVSSHYPDNEPANISLLTRELNERLLIEGVPVKIWTGAEINITRIGELSEEELSALALGGGQWLLVECPFAVYAPDFDAILLYLKNKGHRVMLAHPERSPLFQRDPQRLEALVAAGMLASITAGSLVGRFGRDVRRFAMRLAADGLAHNVASDAHDVRRRPPGIAAEIAEVGLENLTDWFAHAVPHAILSGEAIPPRPIPPSRNRPKIQRMRWRRR